MHPAYTMAIHGANSTYERRIREALASFPDWYVTFANVSGVFVTNRRDVVQQIAMYEHQGRPLNVSPNVGGMLRKAIGHELAHGIDDSFGHPHAFSTLGTWLEIHRNQTYFDIAKYRDEPAEYFADALVKRMMLGYHSFRIQYPREAQFIDEYVLPLVRSEANKGTIT